MDANTLAMLQASANFAAFTGIVFEPGNTAWTVAPEGASLAEALHPWLLETDAAFLRTVEVGGRLLQVSAHKTTQGVLLEFESPPANARETLQAIKPHSENHAISCHFPANSQSHEIKVYFLRVTAYGLILGALWFNGQFQPLASLSCQNIRALIHHIA